MDMIDDDFGESGATLRMLVSQALQGWSTDALLQLLTEKDPIVRTAVARELQIRGESPIFGHMHDLIRSDQAYLREIAVFVIGQLGSPSIPFKQESIPLLLPLVSDDNADVRSAAAAAFGHLCWDGMPEDVEESLMELCSDADRDVRACAAQALGNSSGRAEVRTLLKQLLSEDYVGSYAELGLEILDTKDDIQR
jgi:HEAT repeat protein